MEGIGVMRHGIVRHSVNLGKKGFLKLGGKQESRREGWTDAAIVLCKLNKSL